MKNKGFTLAEILITLAIIGVVAALTIPTVSRKIQDQQLKTQFKKVYNTLNLAFSKTYFDLGEIPKCYINPDGSGEESWYMKSNCQNFYTSLTKNLKTMKYCNGAAAQGGCIAEYPQLDTSNPGSCASNSYNISVIANYSKVWVLQDGTILFTYGSGNYPMFAVDINGAKNPNKWGYDVFAIDIIKENNKFKLSDISCGYQMVSTGGRKFTTMLKWVYDN